MNDKNRKNYKKKKDKQRNEKEKQMIMELNCVKMFVVVRSPLCLSIRWYIHLYPLLLRVAFEKGAQVVLLWRIWIVVKQS